MANKNTRKILISLIIGVGVACASLNTFSNLQKQIKQKDQLIKVMQLHEKQLSATQYSYITVTRTMKAGETVTANDIKIASFSTEQPDGLDSEEMVIGNVLLEEVSAGQILTGFVFTGVDSEDANPKGLREGNRAITLSVSALEGLSKEMKEGSLVDIFSKSKSNSFILSKVRIIDLEPTDAVLKDDKKEITIKQAKTVTFEIPMNKVQEFVEIYSSGKILLAMRPIGDDTVIPEKKKTTTPSSNYQNLHYDSPTIPPTPVIQTFEDSTINELPAPVITQKSTKTVEIIEAANKTQVSFD